MYFGNDRLVRSSHLIRAMNKIAVNPCDLIANRVLYPPFGPNQFRYFLFDLSPELPLTVLNLILV